MAKKRAVTPASRHRANQGRLTPQNGAVVVRMYRQGLGDCFLLALAGKRANARPRYVLIDCGVHRRQDAGPQRLKQVMENVVVATGGRLDVVVATHEHADHLSGFVQKGSPFLPTARAAAKLSIGELWVGWTEKLGDRQADQLRKKRGTARAVIQRAVQRLRERLGAEGRAASIESLIDFESLPEDSIGVDQVRAVLDTIDAKGSDRAESLARVHRMLSSAGFGEAADLAVDAGREKPSSNELALALLSAMAERVEYCEPGAVLDVPNVDDVRAYVLGPPRDEKLLKKDAPSKIRGSSDEHGHAKYKEVYLSGASGDRAFLLAPALAEEDGRFDLPANIPIDMSFPFHRAYRRGFDGSRQAAASADNRGSPAVQVGQMGDAMDEHTPEATAQFYRQTYLAEDARWRRIDADWLETAEQLALNLDSDTNNTSLALAFECGEPGRGKVLLFPGDAQVGNWLSWRRQVYRAGGETTTADDLMRRVLVYKVGHHASHNATVRRDSQTTTEEDPFGVPFGLELMDDIIALIPVDRRSAQKPRPWEMPHAPLYRRLREKAQRRVLRSDTSLEPLSADKNKADRTPSDQWMNVPGLRGVRWRAATESFRHEPKEPLYYDIELGREVESDAG